MPSKVYRKLHKVDSRGVSTSATIEYGEFALKALEGKVIGEKELEAAKKAAVKIIKLQGGAVVIRMSHKLSFTSKGIGARLGGGKGGVDGYVFNATKGTVVMESVGVTEEVAKKAFSAAMSKLSIDVEFIKKKFVY